MGWLFGKDKKEEDPLTPEEKLDVALQILSTPNWISPLFGFAQTFYNDPTPLQSRSWTFFFQQRRGLLRRGWNGSSVESLLRQNGIKTWGGGFNGNDYFFTVSLEQAQEAEYILRRSGVPLNEDLAGAPEPPKKVEYLLPAKEKKRGWFGRLILGEDKPKIEVKWKPSSPEQLQAYSPLKETPAKRRGHRRFQNIPCLVNNAHCDSYGHSMSCEDCNMCANHCRCMD